MNRYAVFVATLLYTFRYTPHICFKCYDYSPLYITNAEVDMQFNSADSLDVAKLNLLKELEVKGILLTPSEYTSHISSFYNTVITFLIALFVIFSFLGYFSVKLASKKDIQDKLDEMLDDSLKFRDATVRSILSIISDTYISREELNENIEVLRNDLETQIAACQRDFVDEQQDEEEIVQ